jgi:hypothetical protein
MDAERGAQGDQVPTCSWLRIAIKAQLAAVDVSAPGLRV